MQTVLTAKANSICQQELNKNVMKEFSLPTSKRFVVLWADFSASLPLFLAAKHKNVTVSVFSLLTCFTGTIPQLTRRLMSAPGNLYSLSVSQRWNRNTWKMWNTGGIQQSPSPVIQGSEQYQCLASLHVHWMYLHEAITCVGALQSFNRWQREIKCV